LLYQAHKVGKMFCKGIRDFAELVFTFCVFKIGGNRDAWNALNCALDCSGHDTA
jgi:hypothetical protein